MGSVFKSNRGIIYKYYLFRKNYVGSKNKCLLKKSNFFTGDLNKFQQFKSLDKFNTKSIRLVCFYSGRFRSVIKTFNLSRMVFKYFAVNGLINGVAKASW